MSIRHRAGVASRASARASAAVLLTAAALQVPARPASAQNLFETLLGPRLHAAPSAAAFADPFAGWNPFGWRALEPPRGDMLPTLAWCVRLCDGRYFPIERNGRTSPAQTCSAFCPASRTRVYNGSSIDTSIGADGKPYRDLGTAFVYREKIVPGCSCNGKDAFGLVNARIEDDPTLRPGDIVATNSGLSAYTGNGGGRKEAASFTPIRFYSGLSGELRRRLTQTRIDPMPPASASVQAPPVGPGESTPTARNARNRQVQSER